MVVCKCNSHDSKKKKNPINLGSTMCTVYKHKIDECTDRKYLRGERRQENSLSEEKKPEFQLKLEKQLPGKFQLKIPVLSI